MAGRRAISRPRRSSTTTKARWRVRSTSSGRRKARGPRRWRRHDAHLPLSVARRGALLSWGRICIFHPSRRETPTAGKKASLTLRLELRTTQPPANGKYVFSGICDAEDVVYTARPSPLRRSRSNKHHPPIGKRFCGAKHWRSGSGAFLTTFGVGNGAR